MVPKGSLKITTLALVEVQENGKSVILVQKMLQVKPLRNYTE